MTDLNNSVCQATPKLCCPNPHQFMLASFLLFQSQPHLDSAKTAAATYKACLPTSFLYSVILIPARLDTLGILTDVELQVSLLS